VNPDMTPNVVLVLVVAALVAAGVYLVLERSLTRIIIGIVLIGNGVNVLFLVAGGRAGGAPIVGSTPTEEMSDPLPQAMVLTAIVITLGMTAFLLAMAYRSWQLNRHDEVQDDLEDRRIARIAAADQPIFTDVDAEATASDLELDAAQTRDETSEDAGEVVRR
jgi:multicomponent Na+:H+ antiporter subunit C